MEHLIISPGFYPFGIKISKSYKSVFIESGWYFCPFTRDLIYVKDKVKINKLLLSTPIKFLGWGRFFFNIITITEGEVK